MVMPVPPMRRALLAILLLCLATPVAAVQVKGLFQVSVPVNGQGDMERKGALYAAFSRLLVRVGAGRAVLRDARAQPLLQQAPRFVQSYRYRETPEGLFLEVRFDARAVRRALIEQGLPLWGRTRPLTLVWLVVQEGGERHLLNGDSPHPAVAAMEAQARERALPLAFPLLDLEDQMALGVTDVWAGFTDRIVRASQRYAPEAVLVGRLYRDFVGTEWIGRWQLLEGERVIDHWQARGDLDWVAGEGVERAADGLAARYAQRPGESAVVRLWVTGAVALADYARVGRYLAGLSMVERVAPVVVEGGRLGLDVRLRSDLEGLTRAIALGSVLVPAPGASPDPDEPAYRLLPP